MIVRALLSFCLCGILSAQGPDAGDILSRIRGAVGYAVLAAKPRGFRATGTIVTSGVGGEYQFSFQPGRAMTRVLGRLGKSTGKDGSRFWLRESSGEVHPAGPMDRDDIRFDAAILAHAYLDPGEGFLVERSPEADTPDEFALRLGYPGSPVNALLFVDRVSALPRRFSLTAGARTTSYGVQAYIGCSGLRIPSQFTVNCDGSIDTVHIMSLEPSPGEDFSMPADSSRATFAPGASPDLEVVRDHGVLLVHPLLNGKDVGWFVFDTGAGINVLTPRAVRELGLESFGDLLVEGMGGSTKAGFVKVDQLKLGPAMLTDSLMASMDLSFLSSWHRIAGILGYGLLANLVVKLDAATPAIALQPALDSLKWHALVIDRATPHVEATVEGHPGMFLLDSGYTRTMLIYPSAVKAFNLLEGRRTTSTRTSGVGGSIPSFKGTVSAIDLEGPTLRDSAVVFAAESKATSSNPYLMGSIGSGILSAFVIILDYRGQRIALTPR